LTRASRAGNRDESECVQSADLRGDCGDQRAGHEPCGLAADLGAHHFFGAFRNAAVQEFQGGYSMLGSTLGQLRRIGDLQFLLS